MYHVPVRQGEFVDAVNGELAIVSDNVPEYDISE